MSETVRCPCKQCHFVPATRTDSEVWVCDTPGGGWRLGNNVYCPKCGRHLKPGGEVGPSLTADLAALREDAERWRALEALDRGCGGWHLHAHEGHPPANCVIHYTWSETYYTGATFAEAFDAMRAALDPEVPADDDKAG